MTILANMCTDMRAALCTSISEGVVCMISLWILANQLPYIRITNIVVHREWSLIR